LELGLDGIASPDDEPYVPGEDDKESKRGRKAGSKPKTKARAKAKTKTKASTKKTKLQKVPLAMGDDFGASAAGVVGGPGVPQGTDLLAGEEGTLDGEEENFENDEEHDIDDDDNEEEETKVVKKSSRKDEPSPTGPPLQKDAIVQHRADLLYYSTGRNKKEKKKCIGCRKAISPGTLRVYFPNQGCRHLHKCFHAGLGHGLYYTASALNNFDIIKPADRDRVIKRLREMHRDTSELRSASGKTVHGWSEADYGEFKRWPGLMDVQVVAVHGD